RINPSITAGAKLTVTYEYLFIWDTIEPTSPSTIGWRSSVDSGGLAMNMESRRAWRRNSARAAGLFMTYPSESKIPSIGGGRDVAQRIVLRRSWPHSVSESGNWRRTASN